MSTCAAQTKQDTGLANEASPYTHKGETTMKTLAIIFVAAILLTIGANLASKAMDVRDTMNKNYSQALAIN